MSHSMLHSIPRWYYLVTPAFILLDHVWGINVRVAVLDELPVYKNLYDGLCVVCGVLVFLWPRGTPFVAFGESTINVGMAALAVFLPCVRNVQHLATLDGDWKAAETFGIEGATNIVLAGVIAVIAFHQSLDAITATFRAAGPNQVAQAHDRDM